ncbi:MAG: hypothetical protein GX999_10665 [Bacteroidales bacterium]|nr:hypothetical protein [Bacteroidales bacterium]
MRKRIKIKATLIFLSWLMIMAHSIIPHNHQESNLCMLSKHSHAAPIMNDEYHSHTEGHEVCQISSILYHQIAQDNLFIESSSNDYSFPELWEELTADNNKHSFYRTCYYASASFRAPPAA